MISFCGLNALKMPSQGTGPVFNSLLTQRSIALDQVTLLTERLRLRPWCDADREPFALINADPRVMEFFPALLSRDESDAMVDRTMAGFAERGWGLWAVDVRETRPAKLNDVGANRFIGYVGLAIPRFETHFTPCVEIGWRLAHDAWGHGYATEAARRVLEFGFTTLKLPEIVSFTSVLNARSLRVMQRLGMTHDPGEDFDHPVLPPGHRLERHALYRMKSPL